MKKKNILSCSPDLPLIFVLSSGADPLDQLYKLAAKLGYQDNIKVKANPLVQLYELAARLGYQDNIKV